MKYVLFLVMVLFSGQAVAINCAEAPDCAELGYSNVDDPNCKEEGYLICPFDSNYKKCVELNCQGLGYTNTEKSGWCKNIAACPNNKNYTACIKATCEIGDVYYSDGSCGLVEDYIPNNQNKIPVGVVFYVTDNGYHGKVISLKNLTSDNNTYQFDPQNPYNNSNQFLVYGLRGEEDRGRVEGLRRYTLEMFKADALNRSSELFTGAKNTDILAKAISKNELCQSQYQKGTKDYHQYCIATAALATRAFYPPEVSADNEFVGQGKWYLPAIGELMDLYGYDFNQITGLTGTDGVLGNIKEIVNKTLESLKAKGVDAEKFTEQYHYWASNQTETWFFKLSMVNGSRDEGALNNYARASLEF